MTKINNTDQPNDNIDSILKNHGKRIQPNELMARRAMKNVHTHWQANIEKQQQKKKQRQTYFFRIAATVLLFIGTSVFFKYSDFNNTQGVFSTEQFVQGDISYSTDGINWYESDQKYIEQGIWLKTKNNSYTNITLADNSTLRVNQNSIIEFLNLSEVRIINGEIYHDADNVNKTNPLTIITNIGNIQHIGTRYLVNKSTDDLKVSVRNGLVNITSEKVNRQLQSGKQVTINNTGIQSEEDISSYDVLWNWTQLAAQPFNSQGKSLNDFIVWYAHENGYQVNWNNLQAKTKRVKITGDISQLNKSQQIKTIFLSTTFDYEINQGILSIL